jgi:hypothetical protein
MKRRVVVCNARTQLEQTPKLSESLSRRTKKREDDGSGLMDEHESWLVLLGSDFIRDVVKETGYGAISFALLLEDRCLRDHLGRFE